MANRVTVNGKNYPGTLSYKVVQRIFATEEELGAFMDKYIASRHVLGNVKIHQEPTDLQKNIAAELKAAGNTSDSVKAAVAKYGITKEAVYAARTRVAMWQYMNS